jgi:3-hydroxyacyl-CoA dehydrogenase
MNEIRRVAVLGSGVMGGAIAAHLANCGIPSLMLDIVPPNLSDADKKVKTKRNAIAQSSKDALKKAKPSPVYSQSVMDLIEIGNLEDDMPRIKDCDWIVEVVKEDLGIKKKVFTEVVKHRAPGSIVSTNTSGISVSAMTEVMDDDTKQHFLGTHFFNPPRYLKLLEIISGPDTKQEVIDYMARFFENKLGKGVVYAKDTPNFIANRILTFSSCYIMEEMQKDGLSVEEVDMLTGPLVGHASSATFRTADLVGLDTMVHVLNNVVENAPNDERRDVIKQPAILKKMLDKGYLGQKSGSGFYKATNEKDEKGKRIILGLDFETMEYRPPVKPRFDCTGAARNAESLEDKIKIMHTGEDKGSQFAWKVFANTAVYAGNRIPEIADDIVNIDNAVKWGFAWEIGIFEKWDALGFDYVCDRMMKEGLELPPVAKAIKEAGATSFYKSEKGEQSYFDVTSKSYKPVPKNPNIITLALVREAGKVIKENGSASLFDLGDGIILAEFHTKMNAIDADLGQILMDGVELLNDGKYEGMVIGNQAEHFCAGANVFVILGEAMQQNWGKIEEAVDQFQQVNMAMRYCKRPIVAAPHHYTLGGGMEIAQHSARCVIAGETYGGLVEVGVGLIPGGGGCKEMLRRALEDMPTNVDNIDPEPFLRRAFMNIALAKVGTSGKEVVEFGYLTKHDIIFPSFDQQVKKAKDVCLALVQEGYEPPTPKPLTAFGEPIRAVFKAGLYPMRLGGYASEHDEMIANKIGWILTGGDRRPGTKMSEQDVLDLEREAFVSLIGTEKSQQRVQHMLTTGKPLRN